MTETPLIITAALTGSIPRRKNSLVPIDPEEIAQSAKLCYEAGAAIVHIHARDKQENPTLNVDVFSDIFGQIQALCPQLIIQISTGGRAGSDPEARGAPVLKLRPEMASLTTGSVNFKEQIYENSPDTVRYLAEIDKHVGAKPELEIFTVEMIKEAQMLFEEGLIDAPMYFNFVMGLAGGTQAATVENLARCVSDVPAGSLWNVSAVGVDQLPMIAVAMTMGRQGNVGVRVGIEDNTRYKKGVIATNEMLVARAVRLAYEFGRKIATPDEAREVLGLRR